MHNSTAIMLLLYLFALQIAVSYGDFMCMYTETVRCYMPILKIKDYDYCTSHDEVMECMEKQAVRCRVENSTEFLDMKKRMTDVCQEGTELNKEYSKHKSCYVEALKAASKAPCNSDFRNATTRAVQALRGVYLEEFKTSDDAKAELIAEVSCGYWNGIKQCTIETLNQTCGQDAMVFFQKAKSPKEHFMQLACEEDDYEYSAAATSNTMLLFQVSTALFALKMYKLGGYLYGW